MIGAKLLSHIRVIPMSADQRIEQFKKMAESDPENELGHFSLGKAYLDNDRFDEAIVSLSRVIELNDGMSKGYQILGDAFNRAGQRERAVETLTRGVSVADKQGDRMPRDAMATMLKEMGAPVPAMKEAPKTTDSAGAAGSSSSGFQCARCRRPNGQLEKVPFKGAMGLKILENVCSSCWHEWISMGTKVINELALTLSTKAGKESYDQYMIEFLQLEDR